MVINIGCFAVLKTLRSNYFGENVGQSSQFGRRWVTYLDQHSRTKRELRVDSYGRLLDASGRHYSTSDRGALFVLSRDGRFYSSDEGLDGFFHHSSFVAGEQVWMAGKIVVSHGRIIEISNDSGHYKPGPAETFLFMSWLQDSHINLAGIKLNFIGVMDTPDSIRQEFSREFGMDPRHIHFGDGLGVTLSAKQMAYGLGFF